MTKEEVIEVLEEFVDKNNKIDFDKVKKYINKVDSKINITTGSGTYDRNDSINWNDYLRKLTTTGPICEPPKVYYSDKLTCTGNDSINVSKTLLNKEQANEI